MSSSLGARRPLALGVGLRRGMDAETVRDRVTTALHAAGIAPGRVVVLATLASRQSEPALRALAEQWHWSLVGYPAARLAGVTVPTPSVHTRRAVGTASVAEAAALLAAVERIPRTAGAVGLLLPKCVAGEVTVAVAGAGSYPAGGHMGGMPERGS